MAPRFSWGYCSAVTVFWRQLAVASGFRRLCPRNGMQLRKAAF
jgi:hypothetical protein